MANITPNGSGSGYSVSLNLGHIINAIILALILWFGRMIVTDHDIIVAMAANNNRAADAASRAEGAAQRAETAAQRSETASTKLSKLLIAYAHAQMPKPKALP